MENNSIIHIIKDNDPENDTSFKLHDEDELLIITPDGDYMLEQKL